ncbi:MAG: methionine aminotransferase [Casimicrobiaceae bacterium]|nr:methionine aminotransferase [Casimicrobiaceae bacterium]
MDATPTIESKLPHVGTTIFTIMSALAQEVGAINLGQGFPDFDPDPRLLDCVNAAMRAGHNQYPPMAGNALLRQRVRDKFEATQGVAFDPQSEVTITSGATQAILSTIMAVVRPGDEVVVLEPAFDSYLPNIALAGGVAVPVALKPGDFRPDFEAIERALTPRTRLVLVNTPHNPSGRIWRRADWERLAEIIAPRDIFVLSDEVYEHMVYDGEPHVSAAAIAALRERSFVVSSFGKTLHVTGWKLGCVLAPAPLTAEFRKVHQFTVFTANSAMQQGIAEYLADPTPWRQLPAFYQAKRDRFLAGLKRTALQPLPCEGSYFVCTRYDDVPRLRDLDERAVCEWLTREIGVAAIPLSAFYAEPTEQRIIRFCFAKREETLDEALKRLARL